MNGSSIIAALATLQKLSADNGNIPLEQTGGIIQGWEAIRTTEQLTAEEKRVANNSKSMIAEIYSADPDAELDPADIADRIGLPDKQGSRSFVRHQLRLLRLTYRGNANGRSAAAD